MRISILCSDDKHPVYPWLEGWLKRQAAHQVELVQQKDRLSGGEILILVSCHDFIDRETRAKYGVTLVIHASDLPRGRGWSPHIWQVLEGKNKIVVTLLEADDNIDSGAIWTQKLISLEGHELVDEINAALFDAEVALMDFAVENYGKITPRSQDGREATYYPRRIPQDSRIDPYRDLASQFDLLRVADPCRYPAFFDLRGKRYAIRIEKIGDAESS
jgi:methionyl-tRNA formyltransferase